MSAVVESSVTDRSPMAEPPVPLVFTDSAASKVKELVDEEGNPDLKLRVFVQGGGCSGFQYGFTFDEVVNDDDTQMSKNGVTLLIDAMSLQYLRLRVEFFGLVWLEPGGIEQKRFRVRSEAPIPSRRPGGFIVSCRHCAG
jgi:iron-sulfur cluster insertion protein